MARKYGPADYDPDAVPTWYGMQRTMGDYYYYRRGYYPYGFPPELMRREYVADELLHETTMAMSEQIEAVADMANEGIDVTVEALNEGVSAVAKDVSDTVNEGVEAAETALNSGIETVMDTRHEGPKHKTLPDMDGGEAVYSTAHGQVGQEDDEFTLNPVRAINNAVDDALDDEKKGPGTIETLGNASWTIASGIESWAESVQGHNTQGMLERMAHERGSDGPSEPGTYSTRHDQSSMTAKMAEAFGEDGDSLGGVTYSTRGHTVPDTPEQDRNSMMAAFAVTSVRDYPMNRVEQPKTIFRKEQLSREEMQIRQMERYQKSLELVANIDFGGWQREASMSM